MLIPLRMDPDIKTEIVRALKHIRKPSASTGKFAAFWDGLSSPFVVTVLGGLLLFGVTSIVTQWNAQNIKEREISLEKLKRRQDFVETFATRIERYLELTYGLRKRGIFIAEHQSSPIPYLDGRSFDETRKKWEDDERYWLEHSTGSASGLIYTAKIFFPEPAVQQKLNALATAIDQYEGAELQKQLTFGYNRVILALEDATSTMTSYINENPNRSPDKH